MTQHRRAPAWCWCVVLALQAACFPVLTHGPRVEQGLSLAVGGSAAAGPTHTEGDEGGVRLLNATMAGLGAGYGLRGVTRQDPSLSVGLFVPIAFPAAQLDLFAQMPEAWTGPTAGGLGVNVSGDHVAPYVQWGMVNSAGEGWSLLQGMSVRLDNGQQHGQLSWTPGVAAHVGTGRHRLHLYVMGAFGHLKRTCFTPVSGGVCRGDRAYAVMGGATWQLVARKPNGG